MRQQWILVQADEAMIPAVASGSTANCPELVGTFFEFFGAEFTRQPLMPDPLTGVVTWRRGGPIGVPAGPAQVHFQALKQKLGRVHRWVSMKEYFPRSF